MSTTLILGKGLNSIHLDVGNQINLNGQAKKNPQKGIRKIHLSLQSIYRMKQKRSVCSRNRFLTFGLNAGGANVLVLEIPKVL